MEHDLGRKELSCCAFTRSLAAINHLFTQVSQFSKRPARRLRDMTKPLEEESMRVDFLYFFFLLPVCVLLSGLWSAAARRWRRFVKNLHWSLTKGSRWNDDDNRGRDSNFIRTDRKTQQADYTLRCYFHTHTLWYKYMEDDNSFSLISSTIWTPAQFIYLQAYGIVTSHLCLSRLCCCTQKWIFWYVSGTIHAQWTLETTENGSL